MKKTILLAAVMFCALSVAAFAQSPGSSFTVGSDIVTYVACCGLAEKTGDVQFNTVTDTDVSVTGTLTVTYSLPITNDEATGITLVTHAPAGGTAPFADIVNVTKADATGKGSVTIAVGAGGLPPFNITLRGVRVNVSGNCPGGEVTATITSVGNKITSGENTVKVVNAVAPAITMGTAVPVAINAADGTATPVSGVARIVVSEGFLDAFGLTNTTDPSQTLSKMIRLTLSGTIPTGVTVRFPVNDVDGLFQRANSAGLAQATELVLTSATTTPIVVYYRLIADSDPAVQEALTLDVPVETAGPYPLTAASVTFKAHIAPIGTESSTTVPRYLDSAICDTASAQLFTVSGSATTTLLIPYAVIVPEEMGGYNTGIAIANTTIDPGPAALGVPASPVPQDGKITFYFYAQDGSTFNWSTTDDPEIGSGQDVDTGIVPAGGLYAVMVDKILEAKGKEGFSGYIFIITDFTHAHAEYFISDFDRFTHGALALVVTYENPLVGRQVAPESLGN